MKHTFPTSIIDAADPKLSPEGAFCEQDNGDFQSAWLLGYIA